MQLTLSQSRILRIRGGLSEGGASYVPTVVCLLSRYPPVVSSCVQCNYVKGTGTLVRAKTIPSKADESLEPQPR